MRCFLQQLGEAGFSGVINYPTIIRFDGKIRRDLESVGLGFAREVEMIATAREVGLYTTCYVATADESRQMAEAGVDLIVPHIGLTTGGTIGAGHALTMEDAIKATQDMIHAARAINPHVIALAHGGPMEGPKEVAYVLEHTDAQGFVGASSFERLPVERPWWAWSGSSRSCACTRQKRQVRVNTAKCGTPPRWGPMLVLLQEAGVRLGGLRADDNQPPVLR